MASPQTTHFHPRLPGWSSLLILIAGVLTLLSAGCAFDLQPVGLAPAPSASATQALSLAQAVLTETPLPALPGFDTPDPVSSPTATLDGTATATLTAWPNNTPTFGPSPTRTRTPTLTRYPTRTRAPSLTPTITHTPTVTFTPTPPPPLHQLVRPGLMSKVISPIHAELYAVSGDQGLVYVELVGEDGRVINQQVLEYQRDGRHVWAVPTIDFDIEAVSELARLQVRSTDAYNRPIAISSVDLILLSIGRNEINPSDPVPEPYLIRSPRHDETVQGGLLTIEGLARPVNDSPLILELMADDGALVASQTFNVPAPSGDQSHSPFTLQVPYQVSGSTPVRLILRQEGSRIPGSVALSSETILLEP